jgi:hypothetical protein
MRITSHNFPVGESRLAKRIRSHNAMHGGVAWWVTVRIADRSAFAQRGYSLTV